MTKTLAKLAASTAAYTLIDLSDLDKELRDDIIEDTSMGGGRYGIRVVEEAVNGGARAPLYGYYKDGPDAERWAAAQKELGITASTVDDAEVRAGLSLDAADPRREAALREAAAQAVEARADRIRAGEDAEVEAVTGQPVRESTSRAALDHSVNIVDSTLDPNATNEAADAEGQEAEKTGKSKSKTPR